MANEIRKTPDGDLQEEDVDDAPGDVSEPTSRTATTPTSSTAASTLTPSSVSLENHEAGRQESPTCVVTSFSEDREVNGEVTTDMIYDFLELKACVKRALLQGYTSQQ